MAAHPIPVDRAQPTWMPPSRVVRGGEGRLLHFESGEWRLLRSRFALRRCAAVEPSRARSDRRPGHGGRWPAEATKGLRVRAATRRPHGIDRGAPCRCSRPRCPVPSSGPAPQSAARVIGGRCSRRIMPPSTRAGGRFGDRRCAGQERGTGARQGARAGVPRPAAPPARTAPRSTAPRALADVVVSSRAQPFCTKPQPRPPRPGIFGKEKSLDPRLECSRGHSSSRGLTLVRTTANPWS